MMMYGYVISGEQLVKKVTPESIRVDRKMHTADNDQIGVVVVKDQNERNVAVSQLRHQQHTNCFP